MDGKLNVEYVPVTLLRPFGGNPRKSSEQGLGKLRRSVESFGFTNPILVQRGSNMIIAGHQRLKAAQAAGLSAVPVIYLDFDDQKAKAYNIADNRLQEETRWDNEALAIILDELRQSGVGLDLTGFDAHEIEELIGTALPSEEEEPFDVAEALERIAAPRCREGEVWALGPHRLVCGDATKADTWRRLLGDAKVDLVVTSPPYNVGMPYRSYRDRQSREEYLGLIAAAGRQIVQHLGPGRFVAWNVGVSPESYPHYHVVTLEKCGLRFYRQIVWEKSGVAYPIFNSTLRAQRARHYKPNYKHEVVYLLEGPGEGELPLTDCPVCDGSGRVRGHVAPGTHDMVVLMVSGSPALGERIPISKRYAHDVWRISQNQATVDLPTLGNERTGLRKDGKVSHRVKAHPAAFPVELPRAVMTYLSAPGEIVCDPFAGAGATLIAAEQMGRRAYVIELDPLYCELIMQRWERLTGQEAVRADGSQIEAHTGAG